MGRLIYSKNFLNCYTLIFILVIFSNFSVGNFLLSDFIFTFICFGALIKTSHYKRDKRVFLYILYFVFASILVFLLFGNTRGLLSSLRFVVGLFFCTVLYFSYGSNEYRNKMIDGYCYACVFFSIFVIIQFCSYYILHINIDFSFGEFSKEEFASSYYVPLTDLFYRTGGLFKEPSWYAAYITPVCFMLTKDKRYKELFVCIVGLLMSTSGLGFLILAVYIIWLIVSYNRKLGILVAFVFLATYFYLPFIFERMEGGVENTTLGIRLLEPLENVRGLNAISIIGLNPSYHYHDSGGYRFFANTLIFIYLYFGIIGVYVFWKFICFKKIFILSFVILTIISIEGAYGRVEFWMMILACKMYSNKLIDRPIQ